MSKQKNILIAIVSVILLIISFSKTIDNRALADLSTTSEGISFSIGILSELKSASGLAEGAIDLGKTGSNSQANSMDKMIHYLSLSNALISAQIVLINICKTWLFKVLTIILIISLFLKKYQDFVIKALIITLLVSPGLVFYVSAIQYVSEEAKVDLGLSLNTELKKIKEKYSIEKKLVDNKMSTKEGVQLENLEEKGKHDLSFIDKIEDKTEEGFDKTKIDVKEGGAEAIQVVKFLLDKFDQLALNLFVNALIIFLILPLLYFYFLNLLIKNFFNKTLIKKDGISV